MPSAYTPVSITQARPLPGAAYILPASVRERSAQTAGQHWTTHQLKVLPERLRKEAVTG